MTTNASRKLLLQNKFLALFLIILATSITVVAAFCYFLFLLYYQGRFFPGVKIGGVDVSGQKPAAVRNYLQNTFSSRTRQKLTLSHQGQTYTIDLTKASPKLDTEGAINEGLNLGRQGSLYQNFQEQLQTLLQGKTFKPDLSFDNSTSLISQVREINNALTRPAINAQITLGSSVMVVPAQNGQELDDQRLLKEITDFLSLLSEPPTVLPLHTILPAFSTQTATKYQGLLTADAVNPIKLHYGQQSAVLDAPALLSVLNLNENKPVLASTTLGGQNFVLEQISFAEGSLTDSEPLIDKDRLTTLLQNLSVAASEPAQDAKFNIDPTTLKVSQFQPAKDGKALDINQTATLISHALTGQGSRDINLPVVVTHPKVTASSASDFGIKELIGEGVSHFADSIDNRIYNIDLAASRINGTLIAPGDVFSFNKAVGDISAASGYRQAYVIQSGRTVLGDGGGVCQVSTTVFRAALNTGLPIVARTAHAYRVGYYEQDSGPGLDATVFAPSVDLKFKNDTPGYILVQAHAEGTVLYVDIYGTSDGRQVTVGKPVILSQTPPLPDVHQDDPTLPKGTVKQVDWSAWGAKVYFTRTVTRNGQTLISETFKSNYQPWAAVYLVGTK